MILCNTSPFVAIVWCFQSHQKYPGFPITPNVSSFTPKTVLRTIRVECFCIIPSKTAVLYVSPENLEFIAVF
jgi:hypothetical protein